MLKKEGIHFTVKIFIITIINVIRAIFIVLIEQDVNYRALDELMHNW